MDVPPYVDHLFVKHTRVISVCRRACMAARRGIGCSAAVLTQLVVVFQFRVIAMDYVMTREVRTMVETL